MMTSLDRNIVRLLVVSLCYVGWPTPLAQAELIASDRVETAEISPYSARVHLDLLLDRADVRAALERQGVSADDAKARADALSDDEIERLAPRIDSLPAAGDALGSFLWFGFLVFVVLLITDILGFTKVFSFTRPAK